MEQTSLRVRQSVDDLFQVAVTPNVVNAEMLAKGTVRPDDNEAMTRLFLTMIGAQPSLSYITWGRESGEYVQAFRDHGGQVSVEWILTNEDGGRDLIDFLLEVRKDGTLRVIAHSDAPEALALNPEDGPAAVLCARSETYLDHPPPAEWDGIYAHDTK